MEAFQQAINRAPHNSQFWNGLGTALVFSNPVLSQHCLIFALNRNTGNADAWSNLGILYMRCGQMVLANQAFSNAQVFPPPLPIPTLLPFLSRFSLSPVLYT